MNLIDLNENTYSLELVRSSSQSASITDAAQTGLDITGDICIEAWIKTEATVPGGGAYGIASKRGSVTTQSYYARLLSSNRIEFAFSQDGTGATDSYVQTGTSAYTDGEWVHIAITADVSAGANGIIVYVNGVSQSLTILGNDGTSIYNSNSPFVIGSELGGSNYFDGRIQEVRVWNDIRTAREIRENMYVQLEGTESNLQGYWRFNLGAGDETSNNNDLTLNNSPVFYQDIPFITTKTNIASTYLTRTSGTGGSYWYITDGNQTGLDITGDLSLEIWICLEQLPSDIPDEMCLYSKYDVINNYGYYLCLLSNNKLEFLVAQNGSNYLYYNTDSAIVTVSDREKWVHIAATFDLSARTMEIYKNTESVAATKTEFGTMTAISGSSSSFFVGRYPSGTDYFHGFMDDLKVWSEERTQGEIINGVNVICDGSPANLELCVNADMQGYDKTSNNNTLTPVNDRTFYTIVPYASDGNTESYQCSMALRLDDSTDNYADNFGNFTENNITFASADSIRWADFNGTTSYLIKTFYDFFNFTNTDFSFSFLMKGDTLNSDDCIFSMFTSSTNRLQIFSDSSKRILFISQNSSEYQRYTDVNTLVVDTVHWVCLTQTNAGTTHIYIDGVDKNLNGTSSWVAPATTASINIGRRGDGSQYFDGKLSDFCMWRKALTSTEVAKIWNGGDVLRFPFLPAPAVQNILLCNGVTI